MELNYNFTGILIGVVTFIIIGVFHPIVVKCEYYFGTKCWWWFLVLGIVCVAGSLLAGGVILSAALGVLAFTLFWSIKEIFDQKKRVLKGHAKRNPQRTDY